MKTRRKEDIEIKVKSSEPINCQIAEEIIFLDGNRKIREYLAILGELGSDESADLIIVEEAIFKIRIQTFQAGPGSLSRQRQIMASSRLDDSRRNSRLHSDFVG